MGKMLVRLRMKFVGLANKIFLESLFLSSITFAIEYYQIFIVDNALPLLLRRNNATN